MNRRNFLVTAAALLASPGAGAADAEWSALGRRWIEQNVDPAWLEALRSGDLARVEAQLREAGQRFEGEYVLDLAPLEERIRLALPVLEARPETRGYAAWLRSRLDYFEVAGFLQRILPGRPSVPGQPPPPPPVPTPKQQRDAWQREIEGTPPPKAASRWVPRLRPVFRRAGVAAELVWLAEIESAFDPAARSPMGALGLYQLMPKTATGLGLKLKPVDERLDPDKNARAAATYLRQMHRQFRDWRLALAAYNAGPGRVAELLRSRRATSFDAIAPSLPAETQMYVPRFESVLKRREGRALTSLPVPV